MTESCVQVSCRFKDHLDGGAAVAIDFPDAHTVLLTAKPQAPPTRHSNFCRVFPGPTPQADVFEAVGAPAVDDVLRGYNYTILAYGQTGSGKTHTILGSKAEPGLLPRLVARTFDALQGDVSSSVDVSVFEVYQERIGDLLAPANVNLRVREDKERGIWVEGATEAAVDDAASAMKVIQRGIAGRSTGAHLTNAASSRSHCIFVLTVTRPTAAGLKQTGKLVVVDLAGSEMVRKTAAQGKTLDEAKYINKSLTALGLVINALTDGKSKHVPYRDSKLTRLLQNSLGGNAKTHLILTCSSSNDNVDETMSTIRFGARAQQIRNSPHVNAEKDVSEYKQLVATMERKVEALSAYIAALATQPCQHCSRRTSRTGQDHMALSLGMSASDSDASPTHNEDDETSTAQPQCAACHVHNDHELVLCDGNCGSYWHPACLLQDENGDENGDEDDKLEVYCPACATASQPHANVEQEIGTLKRALHQMKQARDDAEERASVEKQVFDFADQKKSDIHRHLETTIAELEDRMRHLARENDQLQARYEETNQQLDATEKAMAALRRHHQLLAEQNDAELDILRRALDTYERDHQHLQAQIHDLTGRLVGPSSSSMSCTIVCSYLLASDKRARDHQEQLEECRVSLARRDDETLRLNTRLGHTQSFPTLKPTLASPPKLLRSVTVVDDPRLQLQSRGNIQQWWSGPQPAMDGASLVCESLDGMPSAQNNLAEETSASDGTKPFKARLVGLLASLQEETDAFKDLGDKISLEHTRQKTRQKTRRTRRLLPDLQSSDEFNESVSGPQR
ncbi:Aste57867_21008 [Aphanomyces stellatus]|uniref:Kinesin-like protein n=1 Tax=Aphanomyces stellatus TaxID=120398 RepID=A0A485LGD2_9STRA|nr:hypothetical protein As57867_020940 [Aphanomyces stellatus]VFT97683.1 Aste57867_21008 [Aphanomyces stellatus]